MRVLKTKQVETEPLVYYDHTKAGVNGLDIISTDAFTREKPKQWPLKANFFLYDIFKSNTQTLYNKLDTK